ncbi:hypothetical protein [Bacillus thuringiensis]|uniref:hypothetical protein n=1 Tax=Bacillus thuringiensis TaxID=1428 RepID=UPI0011A7F575|nr:hypothetical protein [Bacillus thuringiensis]
MKFTGKKMKLTCATLALSVGFGLSAPSFSASAAELNSNKIKEGEAIYSKEEVKQLTPILQAIEEIPDELLVEGNEDAVNEYFKNKNINVTVSNDSQAMLENQNPVMYGAWECSLAIGEIIVMNAIPIAKLTKIKKYVKALGGAWNTAKLLVGATNAGEKWAILTALIAELSGFTKVKNDCGL